MPTMHEAQPTTLCEARILFVASLSPLCTCLLQLAPCDRREASQRASLLKTGRLGTPTLSAGKTL